MSCSWIVLEVVARAARSANSGSVSLFSNFVRSLQLLRGKQSLLVPTDLHNDLAKRLSEELRAHCEETLRNWQTKVVQVPRVDVGNVIGMHGFALQALEDVVQAVSRGKLLPNRWHFIDSMAEASDSAVQDPSRDHISTLPRGTFRVGTVGACRQLRHCNCYGRCQVTSQRVRSCRVFAFAIGR